MRKSNNYNSKKTKVIWDIHDEGGILNIAHSILWKKTCTGSLDRKCNHADLAKRHPFPRYRKEPGSLDLVS